MKIVIDNVLFDYDLGCKLLKRKYQECPQGFDIEDIWQDIVDPTLTEVLQIQNSEDRRVALQYLSFKEFKAELIDTKTVSKLDWIGETFEDTYELYKVNEDSLRTEKERWYSPKDYYFVKCKDTSTSRVYHLWVKYQKGWDAIDCIAWTIKTTLKQGSIKGIYRQGDCILFEPMKTVEYCTDRHLSKEEYLTLMKAES